MIRTLSFAAIALAIAGCSENQPVETPGETPDAIAVPDVGPEIPDPDADPVPNQLPADLRALGTEPFWAANITGGDLRYLTPENIEGRTISVTRADDGGEATFIGELEESDFTLAISTGPCSDGMSDREYPYMAELTIGEQVRRGCAREPDN